MTIACYQKLAEILPIESAVLATVIDAKGSVPREVGAKMVVWGDRNSFDTIGGGAGEAKVIQQAMAVLATGEKQTVEIDLSGAPQRQTQGICGGWMCIWLERWSGAEAIALVQAILDRLESGRSATLVTPFDRAQSPHLRAAVAPQTDDRAFTETLEPAPTLLIIGAGHVGEQLAKAAHFIGFQIVIQDDRSTWANPQRYPQAAQIFTSIETAIEQLDHHSQLYAALVTRSYQYDLAALNLLLNRKKSCQYIGMIGSKKRVRQVYQALDPEINSAKLRSIYAPIGLDIGALTPEEIAVSIAAELILVRRGGTGQSLSSH